MLAIQSGVLREADCSLHFSGCCQFHSFSHSCGCCLQVTVAVSMTSEMWLHPLHHRVLRCFFSNMFY